MASLLAMPYAVVNLGCEMLYILDQRLKAQGISTDKAFRVLVDVVNAMFDRAFVDVKLFVPQQAVPLASTRKIFDQVAHCSIMRLSEARCGAQQGCGHCSSGCICVAAAHGFRPAHPGHVQHGQAI